MIKCQISSDQNTGDKIMAFRISMNEYLTSEGMMNNLKEKIFDRVTVEVTKDYLKKHKEKIISEIDTQEIANIIKNKMSLEIISDYKKETEKSEKPDCNLHCPSQRANLLGKDLPIKKGDKAVDPELCMKRSKYRCRLINK